VFEQGRAPASRARVDQDGASLRIDAGGVEARFQQGRVIIRRNGREWTVALPE